LGEAPDDVGYTGHKFDKALGLSYMQARYYDPVIGRFYSNDPVDYLGHMQRGNSVHGFGRYTYANNNPYKYTDPDGKAICGGLCVIGVGLAVGYAFDLAIEAIRGDENSTGNTAGNVATGGVVAATGPFADKPRGGIAGGGKAGTKTSVASIANHKAAKDGKISKKTRHAVTKVLRKVPYVGTAIGAGQLVDAVVDRVQSETSNESTNQEKTQVQEKERQND
jgi:RHS repeat-associated protein